VGKALVLVDHRDFASDCIMQSCFGEAGREIRVVVDGRAEILDGVRIDSLEDVTGEPLPWFHRRREFSARIKDLMVVVDHTDRFVWILGAVWTVGSYVGLSSLVCSAQKRIGKEFFWACLNNPSASPNANCIFYIQPLGEEQTVVKYLVILGSRE